MRVASLFLSLLFCFVLPVHSAQLAGIEVPEQVQLSGLEKPLQLNGAGIRKKLFIKVYVAALYLPKKEQDAQSLLRRVPANRVLMHIVYDKLSRSQMDDAWHDGFAENLDEDAYEAMLPRLQQFMALFYDLHEGDRVWLDYQPGEGTRVSINGELRGSVAGRDFNAALLSVWLGREPVTSSLKKALLGADR